MTWRTVGLTITDAVIDVIMTPLIIDVNKRFNAAAVIIYVENRAMKYN
jgi:hypothetical protein